MRPADCSARRTTRSSALPSSSATATCTFSRDSSASSRAFRRRYIERADRAERNDTTSVRRVRGLRRSLLRLRDALTAGRFLLRRRRWFLLLVALLAAESIEQSAQRVGSGRL